MKVLITGDKGFIGAETSRFLKSKGIKIMGYDLMDGFDILDLKQLKETIANAKERPNIILHLAAIARFSEADDNPKLTFETNVLGTRNIAKVAKLFHIPLIYASTGSVYMPIEQQPPITEDFKARGNSVYASTKYMGELYVREHNPHIILRYAHLYGKEKRLHGLVGGFLDRIERGLAPTLYGGKQSNDFTYIKDIVHANLLAVTATWEKWNEVYNIGTGEELTAEVAGKLICKTFNYKGKITFVKERTVDPMRFVYDVSKARNILGFSAIYNFEKGLKDMKKEMNGK